MARERELRRQERRQNRPIVDSELNRARSFLGAFWPSCVIAHLHPRVRGDPVLATETLVLFVRRDFDRKLAEHLKRKQDPK